jgi:hypothetical protein
VNEVLPGSELQHREGGLPRECFARLYKDALNEYMKVKGNIKPGNLLEIRYEDFKKDPIQNISNIYKQLNISGIDQALPFMKTYLEENHPDSRQPYTMDPDSYQLVNKYAEDIIKTLGYPIIENDPDSN